MTNTAAKALTPKVLGDAAEHYALSQFAFAGLPGTKMPDNWKGYDLAVETDGHGLQRVSVKLRSKALAGRPPVGSSLMTAANATG